MSKIIRWPLLLVVLATFSLSTRDAAAADSRPLTLEQRIDAQRAIEQVYWRHRIWPKDNAAPKPSLDAVMPASVIRAKVEDYLKKSNALEARWRRPITGEQLQAELDRMAHGSRDPRLLQELFDALGGDAFLIAETLARSALAERLIHNWYASDAFVATSFDTWWKLERPTQTTELTSKPRAYFLPTLASTGCTNDTWTPTLTEVPDRRRGHTAVWTGTEMIVWGGADPSGPALNTGGRYSPATDTWTPTSTGAGVRASSIAHTAVWTGTEMIVWGGEHFDDATGSVKLNSGSRYDPASDTWTPTSTGANVPAGRRSHTAVWTGTEMIVWGGLVFPSGPSGGRYNPSTDSWTATSTGSNVPSPRTSHTAIWTGTAMIVWGGNSRSGGRYDPVNDSWMPTSTGANVPSSRSDHTAVWTGTEMIVWGGSSDATGGRYDPVTDGWIPTSTGPNAPSPRSQHTAVWTGSKMIVSGGSVTSNSTSVYDPTNDTWIGAAASTLAARSWHTAIWTGTEMIVWGGQGSNAIGVNSGGRYDPTSDSWLPTSMGATVPIGRTGHTAIWTGTEMVVWGGYRAVENDVTITSKIGGRYAPATDSWVPVSESVGAPAPRGDHSAVWTGKEMIVWGGFSFDNTTSETMNTGGRYNPIDDSWTATSTGSNVPPPGRIHAAVWTGQEMIVWPPGSATSGGRYDPRTDSWRTMSPGPSMANPPFVLLAVWTGTEMIVWPGTNQGPGGRYNPSMDSWLPISTGTNAPVFRFYSSLVWTGTEMIVWGGCCDTNTGGRYNPSTDTWMPTSTGQNVASKRGMATAVWTGREMVVWGGWSAAPPLVPMNPGGRYDPAMDAWTPILPAPNLPVGQTLHTAVWTGTEMIVWGGEPGTSSGARYCACPSGRLVYRDADGDGYGDPAVSAASCDGPSIEGYVVDFTDCNDANPNAHPGGVELCDGIDDDCDGFIDESASAEDTDGDLSHDLCDNCRFAFNATQSDVDHDGAGDACDLDDGLIFEWRDDKTSVSWQAEQGPTAWNLYVGDLGVLRATGVYTQASGSNALAIRQCGVMTTVANDLVVPAAGKVSFSLVTGVTNGVEGSLGSRSSGPRPNSDPCP